MLFWTIRKSLVAHDNWSDMAIGQVCICDPHRVVRSAKKTVEQIQEFIGQSIQKQMELNIIEALRTKN